MDEQEKTSPVPVPVEPSHPEEKREAVRWRARGRLLRQQLLDRVWDERYHDAPRPVSFTQRWVQILIAAVSGFREHRCSLRASALSNTTLLSLVPLMTVSLSVLTAMGYTEDFALRIIDQMAGKDVESVAEWVMGFVEKARERQLGGIGAGALFLISIAMVSTIEGAMNSTWGVEKGRSWFRRATHYAGLLVLVPLGFAVVTYLTTALLNPARSLSSNPVSVLFDFNRDFFLSLFRFGVVWFVFAFIYIFVPNTRVQRNAAVVGGFVAAGLWQIAAVIYFYYSQRFTSPRYNQIYGTFAVVLISLVWIYISWCVLLFGAEICCASQNLIDRRRERRPGASTPEQKETLALRLAVLLARPMLRPAGEAWVAPSINDLSDELNVSTRAIRKMLALFCREGVATRVGDDACFTLCRSPQSLRIYDVLRLVRHGTLSRAEPPGSGALDATESILRRNLGDSGVSEWVARPLEEVRTFYLSGDAASPDRGAQSRSLG